ncbi:MAG: SRPBCC family protein [Gammaproteobacteria bacterium]|nr:SRPBCC family protein [Gammaproteobacteria bacterium]MDH4315765.1 SRPBCC family protein [Gammaproteobacteria bacterium]MDH5214987.1 SRPBCC family protein [Gammaproteobacteria bacterium]MDH5501149.1 SRPBCC family protein [Gammaproteobacteria bacterium]
MKLKFEITIDASLDKVWAAFDNPDNMKKWQPSLDSFTPVSGIPGQPDAVSELVYRENGRKIIMTETITERRKPDFLAGIYETEFGKTLVVNRFESIDDNTTRWQSWCNFKFRGVMRFFCLFLAGSIRKRTEADMGRFKLLVETENASE